MVVIGVDSHKRTPHRGGRRRDRPQARREDGRRRRGAGHLELVRWAGRFADRHAGRWRTAATLSRRLSSRPARRRRGASCACRPSSWPAPAARPRARQERSDRRPRGRPGGAARGPAGRHASTGPTARSACSSTTARISSPSGPGPRTGCAGTSTSSTRATSRRPASLDRAVVLAALERDLADAPGHGRPDRPRARRPDPRADAHDQRARTRDRPPRRPASPRRSWRSRAAAA